MFFHNIGNYALMDVDETRYAAMARDMFLSKDFLTLRLNGDYFFEKPPLYFWGECLSFAVFGKVSEFTVRFPAALCGTLSTFLLYFTGKKFASRTYGIAAALILAASLEFNILSKFAILDIVVTVCIGFSVFFGFMTFFCEEQNKKYFWWLFYIFSGLAVMAKGIPGFAVPFGVMLLSSIAMKKFKEIFRPQYFAAGIILFLLIVLPWHIIMMKMYPQMFWDEYIVKHHLQRFVNSDEINRKEPFYFYILTFLWGFLPWTVSAVTVGVTEIKKLKNFKWPARPPAVFLFVIGFLFTFIFFSASSTKLVTYILPVYFFSACIMAYVWTDYIENGSYRRPVETASYIWNGILLIAAAAGILTPVFLPENIYLDILQVKWGFVGILGGCAGLGIWSTLKNKRVMVFASHVIFITLISAFLTKDFFKIDYKFGQDDLIHYAQTAKEQNCNLASFGFSRRYSLLYYYGGNVEMQRDREDFEWLKNKLKNSYVIVRSKDVDEFSRNVNFYILEKGRKYSLVKGE
jgi:4-amino-4-deoxy-L-arabinose transferase-like glycosyltransferase